MATADRAYRRAEDLLIEHLSPEQRGRYERDKAFDLEVNGRFYRITRGWSGNVFRLSRANGTPVERLCVHFREVLPVPDLLLAQKLALETNEALLRATANITHIGPGGLAW